MKTIIVHQCHRSALESLYGLLMFSSQVSVGSFLYEPHGQRYINVWVARMFHQYCASRVSITS